MEMTGPHFAHSVSFSNTSRRSCIMVEITEDIHYEFEEQFSLRFIELEGTSLPGNLVLNPYVSNITILDNEGKLWWCFLILILVANPYRGECWFHQPTILCQGGRRTNDIHCRSD